MYDFRVQPPPSSPLTGRTSQRVHHRSELTRASSAAVGRQLACRGSDPVPRGRTIAAAKAKFDPAVYGENKKLEDILNFVCDVAAHARRVIAGTAASLPRGENAATAVLFSDAVRRLLLRAH